MQTLNNCNLLVRERFVGYMPIRMRRRIVVVIGSDDAEGPRYVRFRIAASFQQALHQPAGSTSLPFTVAEVETIRVKPATIALVLDLLQTPPRFLYLATTMAYPWVAANRLRLIPLRL